MDAFRHVTRRPALLRARRQRHALLATLLIGASAPAGAQLAVPYVMDTLPNGLRLIVHVDRSAPVVTANLWYLVGSGDERPGRTGFAHLFEHLMFMGSEHAPYPAFDRLLEAAGASNNGSTTEDRTNYYENGPSSALPLMLWLEADRMGHLLPTMDSAKVDLQRDVVKNERRQSYENQPYGLASETLTFMLWPRGHPYSWPVIGSMADLSAASLEDVKAFFRTYYAPNNALITVAGDLDADSVRILVRKWFGGIPRGPEIARAAVAPFTLAHDTVLTIEDRVQLPRLYYRWHGVREWSADDAALEVAAYVLAGAKNSRLTRSLVYDRQLASNIGVSNNSGRLDGEVSLVATARPGTGLGELKAVIDAELRRLGEEGPTPRELEQAKHAIEGQFLRRLERVGGFNGKANSLNAYYAATGNPDGFQKDLDRYRAVTVQQVQAAVRQHLLAPKAQLSVVPRGRTQLAAPATTGTP